MAVIGDFELLLMIAAAVMLVGVPVAVLVVLWIVQRIRSALPTRGQPHGPDDRHTTLIDL